MEEYKGISRKKSPKWYGWYWIDTFCTNQDPQVLENDIILQRHVKCYYSNKTLKISFLIVAVCVSIIAYLFTKGH